MQGMLCLPHNGRLKHLMHDLVTAFVQAGHHRGLEEGPKGPRVEEPSSVGPDQALIALERVQGTAPRCEKIHRKRSKSGEEWIIRPSAPTLAPTGWHARNAIAAQALA